MNPLSFYEEIFIDELSSATVARRMAGEIAACLGFPADRRAEAVLVASELAHNHVMHHTRAGRIRISGFYAAATPCLLIASLDEGPGIDDDVDIFHGKKVSGGGLGAGLGTVFRLSDRFDIFRKKSCAGLESPFATVICALLGPDRKLKEEVAQTGGSYVLLSRARVNAAFCGDGAHLVSDDRYSRITLVDSVGLGKRAAGITARVFREIDRLPLLWPPAHLLEELEFVLGDTNGAAVQCAVFDRVKGELRCAGIGNIKTLVRIDGRAVRVACDPGIVGQTKWRRISGRDYTVTSRVRLCMYTDGQKQISELFDLPLAPSVLAQLLFEPDIPQRDDATLLVWQWPENSTNHSIS